jgi:hypothetical protein
VAGFLGPFLSPEWFVAEQITASPIQDINQNTKMVAYQLGNLYLLLAMVGIAVLYTTTEHKVVRNYLIALAIADVGHVGITAYVMEYGRAIDFANWNSMAWGNIGATVKSIELHTQLSCKLIWIPRRFSSSFVWPTYSASLGRIENLPLQRTGRS